MNFELLRLIVLSLGWPVLIIGSIIILFKAYRFNLELHKLPLGKIIIAMISGQVISMISLGIVSTFFMYDNLEKGIYIVLPIFVTWFLIMTFIFFISFKWGGEAAKINVLYYKIKERTNLLEQEKSKLSHVTQNMSTGAILLDNSGKVLFINREAKNIAGFDSGEDEEIYGAILGKFSKYKLKDKIDQCVKGSPSNLYEIELDGKIYEIYLRCLTDHNHLDGDYFGHFIWLRDITTEKLLIKAKDNFITVASHKLRTPVCGIKLLSETLLNRSNLDNDTKEILTEINRSSIQMTSLVNEILQNIDSDTREIKICNTSFNPNKLLTDIIEKKKLKTKNCKINYTLNNKFNKNIKSDPSQLEKIFSILIENSITYTQDNCEINFELYQEENNVIFKISDNGIGIAEEDKSLIFNNFFRAKNAIKKFTEGTGTSLSNAKKIIESLGGKIWFNSELNKGTDFYIAIPIQK